VTTIAAATERLLANITVRTPATAPKA
jgi:hypothetical protein